MSSSDIRGKESEHPQKLLETLPLCKQFLSGQSMFSAEADSGCWGAEGTCCMCLGTNTQKVAMRLFKRDPNLFFPSSSGTLYSTAWHDPNVKGTLGGTWSRFFFCTVRHCRRHFIMFYLLKRHQEGTFAANHLDTSPPVNQAFCSYFGIPPLSHHGRKRWCIYSSF